MTVSKTTNACHSYGTTLLRGGRLIKWKGQVASLSPSLGQLVASVSPVALGRALMVGARTERQRRQSWAVLDLS